MTGMKKIFLNSSYKRAGYIYKSPRNKLFGTSNCKSLSALSSQSSQSPPGYTGHVLGCEAPHQLGHISPPGRGRARCGRREPGGAGAGAAHVRAVGAQLWWVQHWSPWGHCEDTGDEVIPPAGWGAPHSPGGSELQRQYTTKYVICSTGNQILSTPDKICKPKTAVGVKLTTQKLKRGGGQNGVNSLNIEIRNLMKQFAS